MRWCGKDISILALTFVGSPIHEHAIITFACGTNRRGIVITPEACAAVLVREKSVVPPLSSHDFKITC